MTVSSRRSLTCAPVQEPWCWHPEKYCHRPEQGKPHTSDGMFGSVLDFGARFEIEFMGGLARRHRAAVNAHQPTAPFQFGQIRANRNRRNLEGA